MITLFVIIKPFESNAMTAYEFYETIYEPAVENTSYYISFDDLETWYIEEEDIIQAMVDLMKAQEYNKGQAYVWNEVEEGNVYNAKDIILGIFDAPLRILEEAFTFEIFGIEMYNIILFIMTMGVVYFVWKKVKK